MGVFENRAAFVLACYEGGFTSGQANAAWEVIEAAEEWYAQGGDGAPLPSEQVLCAAVEAMQAARGK